MRNMTIGLSLTALTLCLAGVNCQGIIDPESQNVAKPGTPETPVEAPKQRGTVYSARLGNGALLPGISASGNVYVKPQPDGAGGTGGATSNPPANDTCTGELVTLGVGYHVQPTGTLVDAGDDYTTWCSDVDAGTGNPDVVYELDVLDNITLAISITASGFNPALSLRLTSCAEELAGDGCLDLPSATTAEHMLVSLAGDPDVPKVYYLVIDSADGGTGTFDLDFTATAPDCGDGALNPGEECDPGLGINPEDGCIAPNETNECKYGKTSTAGDNRTACTGYVVTNIDTSADPGNPDIMRVGPFFNGSGGDAEANATDGLDCLWTATGRENVFQVTPNSNGVLHGRVGFAADGTSNACWTNGWCADLILYARGGDCTGGSATQLACADMNLTGTNYENWEELEITFSATMGLSYWFFVDGLDEQFGSGQYYFETWLTAP